jgi:predicted RNA-binding protein with RPS1 domain
MSILKKIKDLAKKGQKTAVKAADVNKDGKVNVKDAKAAGDKVAKTATKTASKAKKAVKKK